MTRLLHSKIMLLGKPSSLCGRNGANPARTVAIQSDTLSEVASTVRCGFCLLEMAKQGQELTAEQLPLVAKPAKRRSWAVEGDDDEDEELEE